MCSVAGVVVRVLRAQELVMDLQVSDVSLRVEEWVKI